ncbi:hypothetical protein [Treponema sp. OMZ 787]|uniref:hypothetical protein n=1 Tax=Treponema sp. OMZ 787 TaxID=2563669 RepID=UPI0020A4EA89|nr:hypothetical protein [Treponema sp. OMZ 787]
MTKIKDSIIKRYLEGVVKNLRLDRKFGIIFIILLLFYCDAFSMGILWKQRVSRKKEKEVEQYMQGVIDNIKTLTEEKFISLFYENKVSVYMQKPYSAYENPNIGSYSCIPDDIEEVIFKSDLFNTEPPATCFKSLTTVFSLGDIIYKKKPEMHRPYGFDHEAINASLPYNQLIDYFQSIFIECNEKILRISFVASLYDDGKGNFYIFNIICDFSEFSSIEEYERMKKEEKYY